MISYPNLLGELLSRPVLTYFILSLADTSSNPYPILEDTIRSAPTLLLFIRRGVHRSYFYSLGAVYIAPTFIH